MRFINNKKSKMKYLIEKNVVIPVEKITDDIEEKSIKYSWYNHDWKNIEIYDLENWKLAPIVRYLIEWWDEKRSNLLLWWMIWWMLLIAVILIIIFSWNDEVKKVENNVVTKSVFPIWNTKINEPKEKEEIIVEVKENNFENELKNEIDMMSWLKKEAEIETLRINFELEKKNITIEKLNAKNNDLIEKKQELEKEIAKLENNVEISKNRIIKEPKDEFIYYLGDNIYQKCESALDDKILNNCKELYYKYMKYAENKQ